MADMHEIIEWNKAELIEKPKSIKLANIFHSLPFIETNKSKLFLSAIIISH